jgi:hypothetical protein
MKTTIKQHGLDWFFGSEDWEACPECDNTDCDELDYGPVLKKDGKYAVELKCMNCGCHVIFERTLKEIENGEED